MTVACLGGRRNLIVRLFLSVVTTSRWRWCRLIGDSHLWAFPPDPPNRRSYRRIFLFTTPKLTAPLGGCFSGETSIASLAGFLQDTGRKKLKALYRGNFIRKMVIIFTPYCANMITIALGKKVRL